MDVLSALSYGIIGLGAILAVLAFYLLYQSRDNPTPIYVFMVFSIAILIAGLAFELNRHNQNSDASEKITQLEATVKQQSLLLERDKAKFGTVASVLNGTVAPFEAEVGFITNLPCGGDGHGRNPARADEVSKKYRAALESMKIAISIASGS